MISKTRFTVGRTKRKTQVVVNSSQIGWCNPVGKWACKWAYVHSPCMEKWQQKWEFFPGVFFLWPSFSFPFSFPIISGIPSSVVFFNMFTFSISFLLFSHSFVAHPLHIGHSLGDTNKRLIPIFCCAQHNPREKQDSFYMLCLLSKLVGSQILGFRINLSI